MEGARTSGGPEVYSLMFGLHGVSPTIDFVEIAQIVDNSKVPLSVPSETD
jgi:hypothetical protein